MRYKKRRSATEVNHQSAQYDIKQTVVRLWLPIVIGNQLFIDIGCGDVILLKSATYRA